MREKAIIFLGGKLNLEADYYHNINYNEYDIYCGDRGANHLYNIDKNIRPIYILGDLDSIDKNIKKFYIDLGVDIKKYPEEKDFTDGELLIGEISLKYKEILILGGLGGQTDHFLTNLNLLEKYKNIIYEDENEMIFFVEKNFKLESVAGKIISFIPLTDVGGLTLKGFKYQLNNYNLPRSSSLCTSNVAVGNLAYVTYTSGSILGIIQK